VTKVLFGDLIRKGREEKGYSLRQLAVRVRIDYSRLAKIEHGVRPAPGLSDVRTLAQALDLDMVDLLVAAGTPREVMEHLFWSERLQVGGRKKGRSSYAPGRSPLLEKNTYHVRVIDRDGARCTVALGGAKLAVFAFDTSDELLITIPPEAVLVFREQLAIDACVGENALSVRIKKIRRLGQVTNIVLIGDGFEINSLHAARTVARLKLSEGDKIFAAVQSTAIRTKPFL